MKSFILFTLLVLFSFYCSAQILVGPSGGLSASGFFTIGIAPESKTTNILGARVGAYFYARFSRKFAIQAMPGYLVNGGGIFHGAHSITSFNPKTPPVNGHIFKIQSIDLPIGIAYSLHDRNDNKLIIGLFPYVRYNLSGNAMYSAIRNGNMTTYDNDVQDIVFDDNFGLDYLGYLGMKRYNYGVGVNMGYIFRNKFIAYVHYQRSVAGFGPQYEFNRTHNLGISLSYLFMALRSTDE